MRVCSLIIMICDSVIGFITSTRYCHSGLRRRIKAVFALLVLSVVVWDISCCLCYFFLLSLTFFKSLIVHVNLLNDISPLWNVTFGCVSAMFVSEKMPCIKFRVSISLPLFLFLSFSLSLFHLFRYSTLLLEIHYCPVFSSTFSLCFINIYY